MKIRLVVLMIVLVAAFTAHAATLTVENAVTSPIHVTFYAGPLNAPTVVGTLDVAATSIGQKSFDSLPAILRASVPAAGCFSDAFLSGDATYVVSVVEAGGKKYCSVAKK